MRAPKASPDEGSMLGQWNSLIRRARIGRDHKAAALVMSSYADADGSGIRLSPARYAVDLEVSYSTARRYLTWLRKVGLLEMTRAGNRRKQTASEYRLILGPDVLEHLEVLSPTGQKDLADAMREAERTGTRTRTERMKTSDQRSPEMSVDKEGDESDTGDINAHPEEALMEPINAQMAPDQRSPWMTYTPSRTHLSDLVRPSRADDEELGTDVTGPRVSPEDPNPDSPLRPTKCPEHGLGGGVRPDGKPECTICRVTGAKPSGPPDSDPDPPPDPPGRCDHTPLPGKDRCRTCAAERVAPVIQLDSRRTA